MKKLSLNKFADELMQTMPLMFREFARREDNALVRGKISCPQMLAMNFASERSEVTVGEIAQVLSSEKSSVSVLLDRLVREKMMRRRHDVKDRRVVWMSLTPRGRKVIDQIMDQKRMSFKAIFGKLTPSDRNRYLTILRKVSSGFSKTAVILLAAMLFSYSNAQAFGWWGKKVPKPVPTSSGTALASKSALSLQDAYLKALKRSESVAITAEEINLARARFYRAFDYFLPTVHFEMTRFEQDVDADTSSSGSFNFSRRTYPEKKFTFSQPLFSGFKEFAALKASGSDKQEQAMKYQRAKEMLFVDVVEAYYTVLTADKDMEVLYDIHRLMSQRFKDLRSRVGLGRSRESELKTSLADIKILESDLVDARNASSAARRLLEFYLGEDLDLYRLAENNGESRDVHVSLESSRMRSDVIQYEQAYKVAVQAVVSANADFFPKISLDGNYYTQRVGFQNGNDWDVTFKFDVPIFEVGQTLGDVREAASLREQARLAWEEKKRSAYMDAQDAYDDFMSALRSETALDRADRATQANYEILQKEFSTNLVNNLDVLDALRRQQDVRRRSVAARYAAKVNYWKLRLALGDIPGVETE